MIFSASLAFLTEPEELGALYDELELVVVFLGSGGSV